MNANRRSHGLWETSAPPAPATNPLSGALRVDAVVVVHLGRGDASVALLESAEIAFGGSGGNFSGYNGRGIAPGTVFGRELAKLVLGETTDAVLPLPVTAVVPMSLRRMREAVYERGAQLVHAGGAR